MDTFKIDRNKKILNYDNLIQIKNDRQADKIRASPNETNIKNY